MPTYLLPPVSLCLLHSLDLVEVLTVLSKVGAEKGNPVLPMKATEGTVCSLVLQPGILHTFPQQHKQFLKSLEPETRYVISTISCTE